MIAIASDHGGFLLKKEIKDMLLQQGAQVDDLGTDSADSVDYPEFAHLLARGIQEKKYDTGILVCGSGIGMSMTANRHDGVRAALCTNEYMARMARKHNDANVLCLGERVLGSDVAKEIVKAFLRTEFEGGRHAARVKKIESTVG